jgi:hypothetical protein
MADKKMMFCMVCGFSQLAAATDLLCCRCKGPLVAGPAIQPPQINPDNCEAEMESLKEKVRCLRANIKHEKEHSKRQALEIKRLNTLIALTGTGVE